MEAEYAKIADILRQKARSHHKKRLLVAIAGIPGSGKTTTAAALLRSTSPALAPALLSMDGFHLSRAVLDMLPNREEAYLRRGAPWTFDASRFVAVVRQLRQWADLDPQANLSVELQTIYAPSFDHEAKDPVEDGVVITPDTSVVIIEGNYCLLNEQIWREVAQLVDYRIFVDTDLQEARRRVAKRHVQAGIEAPLDAGLRRVDSNDSLNALIIQDKLITPDLVVRSVIENA
ncbi:phosphoribulokinase/uridine kinase family protein [Aspergillus brunneoviolaceus CBS 621.78]|uniref:P-loop containing nucleoside triphosphate hydrolase protein n=1 Tax=Aspergillus brunneoviolaceus CBS 621.78 TaxID=1450534 RepID=A0ACD1GHB9_9EURO|nr:P-loop containing nucleoside triphosphate hydrolase protein [Aspergillus brunneoviolaceus CBS 621.78]RAH48656.1 P-loop containing nucleoside triphosphate hydrolase protein [Aspergillus brunneoviolaceus CBS 621.78]